MTNHLVVTARSKINRKCEDDYFSKLALIGKFRTQRPHAWLVSLENHFMAIINVYCLRHKSHWSPFPLCLGQGGTQSWVGMGRNVSVGWGKGVWRELAPLPSNFGSPFFLFVEVWWIIQLHVIAPQQNDYFDKIVRYFLFARDRRPNTN